MKQFPSILYGRTVSNGLQGESLTMSLSYLHSSMALCCPIKFRLFNAAYKALAGWPPPSGSWLTWNSSWCLGSRVLHF